jgi:ribonuclease HIII
VCDRFGDESLIKRALMEKGKAVRLVQTPRAEQDPAVAAASILARDTFLRKLGEMSESYAIRFPKGASNVLETARDFVTTHDPSELGKVAKLHFKTTEKVLKGI